eukprot:4500425-Amphidinium_carterae.1
MTSLSHCKDTCGTPFETHICLETLHLAASKDAGPTQALSWQLMSATLDTMHTSTPILSAAASWFLSLLNATVYISTFKPAVGYIPKKWSQY